MCGYEKSSTQPVTLKEMIFIWYAGLIRGAIAFGLVLRLPKDDTLCPNRDVIVTTCLALVVCTTIVFGSTVGLLGACLFREPAPEAVAAEQNDESVHSDTSSDKFSELEHPNL